MPFTASIVERSFAYVPDHIFKLGGATWLRQLGGPALSAPWERIRIGLLCAVTPDGANNINDTLFLLGLCSGKTNPGSAFITDNFIGASMIGSVTTGATRTLAYTAGSGNPYFTGTVGLGFHKSQALTTQVTTTFSGGLLLPLAGQALSFYQRRALIILDIAKTPGGSGGITLAVYYSTTAATVQSIDMRPDHLFEALDQPGTPSVRGGTFTQVLNSTALTYSPLEGEVDTFEIFWSNSTFPLEISAIGASILRPLSYSGDAALGIADETFEEYAVSSGTISPTTFLTGGSGWSSPGSIFYVQNYNTGTLGASGNFSPQVYSQYVGTTNQPDEPFEQYATGTVDSLITVSLGSYWITPLYVAASVANIAGMTGTIVVLAGTSYGTPYDTFEAYAVNGTQEGTGTTSEFVYGSYWQTVGTIYTGSFGYVGTTIPNFSPLLSATALAGTSYGTPYDTFETYGTGSIISGVTIDGGSYWSGNGSVYP